MQLDFLRFYEIDTSHIQFLYAENSENWLLPQSTAEDKYPDVKKGDLILITPNSTIPQEKIVENLKGLSLKEIIKTESPHYFELPEIRHLLKRIMLAIKPSTLGSKMVNREVDFIIYEVR